MPSLHVLAPDLALYRRAAPRLDGRRRPDLSAVCLSPLFP